MLSKQLEYFLCAYERGSLRTAAQMLHLTQPALTKSIRLLEESIGVVLFERRATGVVPTAHGETLARYARTSLNAWRLAQAEFAEARDGKVGELRIGAGPNWSLRAVPQAMVDFHREYPGIQLSLETDVADYLVPKLVDGDIDLFVGSIEGITGGDEIGVKQLLRSQMLAFVRSEHPLAKAKRPTPADLLEYSWIMPTHDVKGMDALREFFRGQHIEPPKIALRFSSLNAMLTAVLLDDSIAFITADYESEALAHGVVPLKFDREIWSFHAGIAYRRPLGALAHVQRLLELIEQSMNGKTRKHRKPDKNIGEVRHA